MAFDQTTRNRLARFVGDCRGLFTEEFTRQLQSVYGMDPKTGDVAETDSLTLTSEEFETARLLRDTMDHYLASADTSTAAKTKKARIDVLGRIVREQAFTVLNRLCALRMSEARGLLIESIGKGYQSKGFQLYKQLAGPALGETGDAYRCFLFCVFDEFGIDLPVLFDRFSPEGRLFPRESALLEVLTQINDADIDPLWSEDETIGWIYQYFNSTEERQEMRDAVRGGAPRNSRELAVRNQFFTPRYVVEFLTDNTLGRIWYEMTGGRTRLKESCRYLVRRPDEVFLSAMTDAGAEIIAQGCVDFAMLLTQGNEQSFQEFRTGDTQRLSDLAHCVNGYDRHPMEDSIAGEWWPWTTKSQMEIDEDLSQFSTQDILDVMFCQCRADRQGFAPGIDKPVFARLANEVRRRSFEAQESDRPQESMLKQTVYIPFRPLKDPRDIKMLDPACGSMHFGLYAFDLFERIYEEAWCLEAERGAEAFVRPEGLKPLRETYDGKEAFLRDVPRLIIERNIHGIEIDARAVQIAGLSLWLRAQKSWATQGLQAADRPQIQQSNIVCAEPMPGEVEMLEEFLKSLRDDRLESLIRRVIDLPENQQVRATTRMAEALCDLVRTVWKELELAGEAGCLLKIEESLAEAIDESKDEWEAKLPLFRVTEFSLTEGKQANPKVKYYKSVPGEDEEFWNRAEALVLAALHDYALHAQGRQTTRRRLFAKDAASGFAFVDMCRRRFDVAVMNPPFGDPSASTAGMMKRSYPSSNGNILCAFVSRMHDLASSGLVGSISDRTWLQKTTYEDFRSGLLSGESVLHLLGDLGWGVLDGAQVATCLAISGKASTEDLLSIDARDASLDEKSNLLLHAAGTASSGFQLSRREAYRLFPDQAIAHWCPQGLKWVFEHGVALDPGLGQSKRGISAGDTTRAFRCIWEIPIENIGQGHRWCHLQNGGSPSPFYRDTSLVSWYEDNFRPLSPLAGARLQNLEWMGKPGLSWSKRCAFIAPYIMPAGQTFTDEGQGLFLDGDEDVPWYVLALLNARSMQYALNLFCGQHKSNGYVGKLHVPENHEHVGVLADLARRAFHIAKSGAVRNEPSNDFVSPLEGLVDEECRSLAAVVGGWLKRDREADSSLVTIQAEIDALVSSALRLTDEDASLIEASTDERPRVSSRLYTGLPEDPEEYRRAVVLQLLSYGVGLVFGRWKSHATPVQREPHASMAAGPPALDTQSAHDGICANEPGGPHDLFSEVVTCFESMWTGASDELQQSLATDLGLNDCRDIFAANGAFFEWHLSRYAFGRGLRRAAPIYWPLSSPSGSYTLWLYYHCLTGQTLYSCVNDFIDPRLKQVLDETERIRGESNRSSSEERALERLSGLAIELKDFRDELLRIAKFWKPNLNDGVQITAAPLWRFFQHKPWQKKLKETWEKLEAGEYDWAHLALSIWPDRVVRASHKDRSYAIAHDLEDQLWHEVEVEKKTKGGKVKKAKAWQPRELSEIQLDAIVAEMKAK